MKRFIFLFIIALVALAILLFNLEMLEKIWLWIVGLIGVIVSAFRNLIDGIKNLFKSDSPAKEPETKNSEDKAANSASHELISLQKN